VLTQASITGRLWKDKTFYPTDEQRRAIDELRQLMIYAPRSSEDFVIKRTFDRSKEDEDIDEIGQYGEIELYKFLSTCKNHGNGDFWDIKVPKEHPILVLEKFWVKMIHLRKQKSYYVMSIQKVKSVNLLKLVIAVWN